MPVDAWVAWASEHDPSLLKVLVPIRNHIIAGAGQGLPSKAPTWLDVGCGQGLIGFGVLHLMPQARVIFCDINAEVLQQTAHRAADAGLANRCVFLQADAQTLQGVADASVDVVSMRSVLIHLPDHQAVMAACYRVLRPGGRLSLFESINGYWQDAPNHYLGIDITPIKPLVHKLRTVYAALQTPLSERSVIAHAESAGFAAIEAELHLAIRAVPDWNLDWQTLLTRRPAPHIPSLQEALDVALESAEQDAFCAYLQPRYEAGEGSARTAALYLRAEK